MSDRFPVLTIRQPWCWAIVHGGKPVENRSWCVGYRGPLWLHAGARSRWDPDGAASPLVRHEWDQWLRRSVSGWPGLPASDVTLGRRTTLMPFGAVVALAEVTGCHLNDLDEGCGHDSEWWHKPSGTPLCSPWAVRGQWHITLASARPLAEPVPCRGSLSLWRLPGDVEAVAREQLEAVRQRCVYCGKKDYEPGWGCHTCGTATVEDVSGG